ncbi:hypothetical protein [Micromonospora reichwaldensis]|uniref:hypothetical protein n=1 Tax=Micromonospora reichwaldensis TaxID=3075516 RepID=UPI00288A2A71|nr:hypothetical protein [Micromonospora sp. DSM 115977]
MSDSPSGSAGWQPHPPTSPTGPPGPPGALFPPAPAGTWPGHPPSAAGPHPQSAAGPYPPSAAGPHPAPGQRVAYPPVAGLPSAGSGSPPPRRSTGLRVLFVLLAGLLATGLCAGGGIAGYLGWWEPRQDTAERRAIFADWGRPHSFTSDGLVEGDDASSQVYRFTCPQGRCPVDLGERVHDWLVTAGAQDAKIDDVTRCVAHGFQYGGPTCTWTWRANGCRATVTTTGLDKVPSGWDRPLVLNVRIRECD